MIDRYDSAFMGYLSLGFGLLGLVAAVLGFDASALCCAALCLSSAIFGAIFNEN